MTGRDSSHADATVLFNLLCRNLEEVRQGCFSASCFGQRVQMYTLTVVLNQKQTHFSFLSTVEYLMEHMFANTVWCEFDVTKNKHTSLSF